MFLFLVALASLLQNRLACRLADLFRHIGELLLLDLRAVSTPASFNFVFDCFRLGLDARPLGIHFNGGHIHQSIARLLPIIKRERRVKDRPEAVVIVDSDRVVFVIMTLRTSDGHAQETRTHNLDRRGHRGVAIGERVALLGRVGSHS